MEVKQRVFTSDNIGEHVNHKIENVLRTNGIQHQLAVHIGLNGVAERKIEF